MPPEHSRPRLSRYDRPALTLAELMRAEGADFVHQASWTLHGRRADPVLFAQLFEQMQHGRGKLGVLDLLDRTRPDDQADADLPGLGHMLMLERRRHIPLIGALLVNATLFVEQRPALGWPVRFIRSIPGKIRWAFRHSRKFAVRLASRTGLPSRVEMRRTFRIGHEPPAADLSPRAVWIYQRLCAAIDRSSRDQ